jgi:hypothetical protein
MAKGNDVLSMLRPQGGWTIMGDDYEGITFIDCEPVTKEQFENSFDEADIWLAQQEAEAKAKRQALLDKLGITEDEARLLLGGN